jgi:hypothetical protein
MPGWRMPPTTPARQSDPKPAERSDKVYERSGFPCNLTGPVISTRQLYDRWRSAAWDEIRDGVFPSTTATVDAPPVADPAPAEASCQPRWRRG